MSSFSHPLRLLGWLACTITPLTLTAEPPDSSPPKPKKNLIILDKQGVANLQLKLEETQEADFAKTLLALGRIEVFPGNLSVVSSRIQGRAYSVLVKADMEVSQGDELLWIESRQPGDPPPTIMIDAPRDGIISKLNIAPGQPIGPDDSLLEIIDLSIVHAVARVPEHFAGRLKQEQKAQIRVSGYPDKVFEATLAHIGALADAESGTLEASFHVPNPEKLLRPGMKAEFTIVTDSRSGVMAVSREAVQGEGAARFVYVADYELKHAFEKVPVAIGEQNDTVVEILGGLFLGDQVVTQGAYALSFAGKGTLTPKEAMDAAHGHAHAEDGSELSGNHTEETSDSDHEHPQGSNEGMHALTLFFAGLSALLLILLTLSLLFGKRTTV